MKKWLILPLLLAATAVRADVPGQDQNTKNLLKDVDFGQKLGDSVPLDAAFRDSDGKSVRLKDYFGDKPVVLVPVYYECPGLCTVTLNGLVRALRALSYTPGHEFRIVTFSFNPKETPDLAAKKKASYLDKYRHPVTADGWAFLTGTEANIRRVTDAIGFKYAWDPGSKTYVHASGMVVLTPQGRIARVFYGVEYSARDLKFSLIEASHGKIGSPVDHFLLYCCQFNPQTGKYDVAVQQLLKVGGALTVLMIALFVGLSLLKDKKKAVPAS